MNETPVQATLFLSSPAAALAGPRCAVAEDHPARAIHAVIAKLDLRGLDGPIRARGETAGRPAPAARADLGVLMHPSRTQLPPTPPAAAPSPA
jgi:hypothetical protein